MTIATTIDYMLAHPYWKTEADRRIYLIAFAHHIYEQTCIEAAKVYRQNRKFTPTECYEAIKDLPPPTLDFWLSEAKNICIISPLHPDYIEKAAKGF